MAVPVDKTAERFDSIVANTPVVCNWTAYDATTVHVYYGMNRVEAVQNDDYTVTLNPGVDYTSFTITPKTALLTKINALIAANVLEVNYMEVRRTLPVTTATVPASARDSSFVSRELDRITLKLQQLSERAKRAFVLPFNVVNEYDTELPTYSAGKVLMWHPTLKKLINSSIDILANPTQQAIDAAIAAAASAATAVTKAAEAAASAISAAASAATAAGLIPRVVPSGGVSGEVLTKTGPLDGDMTWQTPPAIPAGQLGFFYRTTAPSGWVDTGGTIGDASSGATTRANADTAALFAEMWLLNSSEAPIFTSAGAGSTRGADAATDFAAHKRITVPDARGVFVRGLDNGRGIDSGRRVGQNQNESIGPHTHPLSMAAVADHQHTVTAVGASRRGANGINTGTNFYGASGDTTEGGVASKVSSAAGGHTPTGTATNNSGSENRPRSTAARVCVKL